MEKVSFRVPPQADGLPAKVFLRRFTPVTARLLVACKRTPGGMTRNGALLRSIDKVRAGDIVVLKFPGDDIPGDDLPGGDGLPAAGQAVPFPLAWENESVWIVEKPPGMVVYPTPGHDGETLLQAFAGYAREKEIRAAFRPVYRLDRDTSGLLVLGKDRFSTAFLAENLKKEYMAVCEGVLTQKGWIERAIDLAPGSRIRRCCPGRPGSGQYACTEFIPVCHDKSHTLVRFFLHTGRTHQIRVHMASIGHPLAGDDLYGGSRRLLSRQALHCRAVSFLDPGNGEEIRVSSALPADIQNAFPRLFAEEKREEISHAIHVDP